MLSTDVEHFQSDQLEHGTGTDRKISNTNVNTSDNKSRITELEWQLSTMTTTPKQNSLNTSNGVTSLSQLR